MCAFKPETKSALSLHTRDENLQEELELLGTVTARLCRCLCDVPIPHAQEQPEVRRCCCEVSVFVVRHSAI